MKAIIYTSNTGSTAEYAQLLGKKLNLPVHSLQQEKNKVPAGSEIIYLGWIMAGGIKGYKEAAKLYKVRAVCGIGIAHRGKVKAQVVRFAHQLALIIEEPVIAKPGAGGRAGQAFKRAAPQHGRGRVAPNFAQGLHIGCADLIIDV